MKIINYIEIKSELQMSNNKNHLIMKLMAEIKKRHHIPFTPVTDILLFKYIEKWFDEKDNLLKERVEKLSNLSLKQDISRKKEFVEFLAVSYIYFLRKGVKFENIKLPKEEELEENEG